MSGFALTEIRRYAQLRGKNGGLLLRLVPETVTLDELVRDTGHDLNLVECFGDDNECIITPACRLKTILSEALNVCLAVLHHYTLAETCSARSTPS